MSTIESYGTSGNLPKGSIGNPYTFEEFDDMTSAGTWTGGYVLNMGYVLPEVDVVSSWLGSSFISNFWDSYHWSDPLGGYSNEWDNEWDEEGNNSSSGEQNQGFNNSNNWSGTISNKIQELSFASSNIEIALGIGIYIKGESNITTNSIRFAHALNLPEKFHDYSDIQEGDRKGVADAINAVRHTLWQAVITARYGIAIAKEVGDAHEGTDYKIG